jgi:pantoate--beta-alanine ligase
MLREAGVAVVYTPTVEDLYPAGFATKVSVGALGDMLEGSFRPGFFDGVATVVSKLLLRTLPHVAVFGEKDYQQLCVIRRMVEDLDLAVDIVGVDTLREPDGLAMSSRNAYLSAQQRAIAPKLHATLEAVADDLIDNDATIPDALARGVEMLTEYGFRVDYLELRREDTLEPMTECDGEARLLVAAWLGTTRLIDNIGIGVE